MPGGIVQLIPMAPLVPTHKKVHEVNSAKVWRRLAFKADSVSPSSSKHSLMLALMALVRVCSTCILVYVFLSCLYTTLFLLLCPFIRDCSTSALDLSKIYTHVLWTRQLFGDAFSCVSDDHTTVTPTIQALVTQQAAAYKGGDFFSVLEGATTDSVLYWATVSQGEGPLYGQTLHGVALAEPDWSLGSFAMSESLFLSKAFAGSMHPMKIFPYFHKASETFDEDDITITTLVTPNRFEVLRKLAARYEGMAHAHREPTRYFDSLLCSRLQVRCP